MGFKIIDYFFQSDPFEFNFRLLMLNGFWPINTKTLYLQVLYSIYSFLCFFSPISMLFIQILDLYLLRNDPLTFTKSMCATTMTFASVMKYILIFHKYDELQKLHHRLNEFKKTRTDPEDVKLLTNADRSMATTTKCVYGLAIPCVTVWMLYPSLDSTEQKGLPFPYRLPTDDWSTPVYEILYTYQSLSMIGFMVLILSTDLIYFGMIIRINVQYDLLIKDLEGLKIVLSDYYSDNGILIESEETEMIERFDPLITEKARLSVKDSAMFHQSILRDIQQLKSIYSVPYLIHFLCAVTLVGVIIIDLVVVSKGFKLQLLQRVTYTANGVFDTFLCCYFTTQLEERSFKLMRSIYSTQWYRLKSKVSKDLLLMSMRSEKGSSVRVGHYFPLNLSTFLQFLKLSYNITALLYQTIKN